MLIKYLKNEKIKPQQILFSATFTAEVIERVQQYVGEVTQFQVKKEALRLMGVKNFKIGLDQNEKIEFIADVYKKLSKTMTMIFINERRFAQEIQSKLKSQGIEAKFLTADLELAERD